MANIFVNDYAGMVETIVVTEIQVKTTNFTLTSRTSYQSSFSSTCAVGQPIQTGMRQLALARWNYMYPS